MPNFADLAHRVDGAFGWDDLVLPAEKLGALREICAYVRQRALVGKSWDLSRLAAKGVTVLLSGPSGTGKTMSASVIARELGLELYRVDLSHVSKYIGETEKNLEHLFERAESTGMILFFDEADALFGKRTEVKDAHDRYANIETSYLLQRLEQFRGLTFLSTNRAYDPESPFLRQLPFVVCLNAPEAPQRHELWKRVWPAETELATDIDLSSLARSFQLTGGQIRKVALSAAFHARGEGRNVQMADIIRAATREHDELDTATEAAREVFGSRRLRGRVIP